MSDFLSVTLDIMNSVRLAHSITASVSRLAASAGAGTKTADNHARAILRDLQIARIASDILRLAADDELSLWDTVEGKDTDAAYEGAKLKDSPEKLEASLKLVKRKIDTFIDSLSGGSGSDGDSSDVVTSAPAFR